MFRGVHQQHAVLVEQAPIALHQNRQIAAILEIEPGSPVGQHIGTRAGRHIERRAHTAAAGFVATACLVVQPGHLPKAQLGRVGTALVAAGYKLAISCGDLFEGLHNVVALGFCGVGLGANEHKIVVHHLKALHYKAFGHCFFFGLFVMHQQHIGVAASAHVDGLPGAQCHHFHLNASGLFEFGQQIGKQARLLGRCGGGHHDGLRHGAARCNGQHHRKRYKNNS